MFAVTSSPSALQTYETRLTVDAVKIALPNLYFSEPEVCRKRDCAALADESYDLLEEDYEVNKRPRIMTFNDISVSYFPNISSNWMNEGFCMWRCVEIFDRYIHTNDVNNIIMTTTQYNEQIGLVHCNVQQSGLMRLQRDLGYTNILNVIMIIFY
jgi:hypothetical protein